MASVPSSYTGVPEVEPQMIATPGPRQETPLAAFGGDTARAMSTLGNAIEGAGDKLFARAYNLQQLNNEAEAREADTQYMIEAGKLHADYSSLKGQSAKLAFPKYQEDLKTTRDKIREGLSNSMSQKMYDTQSLSTLGRSIFNGAGHAASEFSSWQNGVSKAQHLAYMDQVLSNPDDSTLFAGALKDAEARAVSDAGRSGYSIDDEATKLLKKQYTSEIWTSKIDGLSRRDPQTAKDLLEGALKKGYILGQDYDKLSPKVDTQLHNIVSRNVSDAVNGGWAPYVTSQQTSRAGGVEGSLVDVIKRAQQNHPELQFMIAPQGGRRTQGEQNQLFAQGRSTPGTIVTWTQQSEHMTGRAIDLAPLAQGTSSAAVRSAMEEAAGQLGVKFADKPTLAAKDPGHFELSKDFDVAGYKPPAETSMEDRQKAAADYVKERFGDQKMTYATRDRVRSDWNQQQTAQRHEQTQTHLQLANFVYDNNVTNRDSILNNPQLSEAYFKLDEPHKRRIDNLIGALAKQPTQETPEKATTTQRILNMSTELGGKRKAFLDVDPADLLDKGLISTGGMKQIYAKQRQIQEGQAQDSRRLQHAISISKSYLKANNITSGSDEETQFTGSMNQWLNDFEQEKKHFPSDEDIRKKADSLTDYEGGFLGFFGRYNFQPSNDFVKEFTPIFQKAHPQGKAPSTEDLARAYQYSISHPNWREEIGK